MTANRSGFIGAVVVLAGTVVLIVMDNLDSAARRWWADHAFTTSVVGGLLVLGVTVLVVDYILTVRGMRDRTQATAAQAAILLSQARRTLDAVADRTTNRDAASDEARTYMTMVLIAAPILIDATGPRAFLERAQRLGLLFSRALRSESPPDLARLEQAHQDLADTASPLVRKLSQAARRAVREQV
jgi:hypothetical protein